VIDRYADGFVMLSLTLWDAMLYDGALVWVIGFGDLHAGEDRRVEALHVRPGADLARLP
jgi:hypothetical protein